MIPSRQSNFCDCAPGGRDDPLFMQSRRFPLSGSVNKVILVGNFGRDPEVRNAQSGAKIVSFSVATSESWNDRNTGERKEHTEWHRVVIFNERLADVAERYGRKGRKVYIEGQLQTRKWADQSGQERYTTEIVLDRFRGELTLLDNAQSYSDESRYGLDDRPSRNAPPRQPQGSGNSSSDLDDEIPF